MLGLIKNLSALLFVVLLLSSCQDDFEDTVLDTANSTQSANGVNGNNNDGRNGNNNDGRNGNNNDGRNGNDGRAGMSADEIDVSVILAWSELLTEIDRYAEGMRPNASARALAYIHLAGYEVAVPTMRSYQSNEDRLRGFNIQGNPDLDDLDINIALNEAYADVTNHFITGLPDFQRDEIGILEGSLAASLTSGVDEDVISTSQAWGQSIAAQVIAYAQTDQSAESQIVDPQPTSYVPPTGDGYWTFSAEPERALFPYWGDVRTFVISPEETSSVDPIPYSEDPSSAYYQEMVDVYEANNTARDNDGEQLWIAEFWSDDVTNITFGPPVRQISIANQLMVQYDMNSEEALYLLLKLGFALNDAAVSTWDDKYDHMVMRPSVFIQEFIDPSYQTNLFRLIPWPNPTFPGYPSGHSCFASAAAGVFIDFLGNNTSFTDVSHEGRTEFRGAPRTFDTFEDMAAENAYSRIPLGVHIDMDCTEGLRLGYEISDAVSRYRLNRRGS